MGTQELFQDATLRRYRELLDAEDAAFDEIEHICEDGDRCRVDAAIVDWQDAVTRRTTFLAEHDLLTPLAT